MNTIWRRITLLLTCAAIVGCTTPKGDFKLDLEQAAFIADVGFRALDYKAEAEKQKAEAQHAKWGWLRGWSESQQARKERLATENYNRIKDDLPQFIETWKEIEAELQALEPPDPR